MTRFSLTSGLLAAALGLSAPAPARTEPPSARVASPWDEEDQEIENTPCSQEDRQRALALMVAGTLLRSPYETTAPPVLPPPKPKVSELPPTGGTKTPPGDNPPLKQAPEPGTLLTGAVGSGLAMLTWLRARRRRGDDPAPA